jgi:hypothetical protein
MGFLAWVFGIAFVVIFLTILLNSSLPDITDDRIGGALDEQTDEEDSESGDEYSESADSDEDVSREATPTEEKEPDAGETPLKQNVESESGSSEDQEQNTIQHPAGTSSGATSTESSPFEEQSDEELSLPFEPINTFEPDPDQWSNLHQETHEHSWPQLDPELNARYDDRTDPDPSSRAIEEAVEWLNNASTEAIHQESEQRSLLDSLKKFIDEPRAAGAEALARLEWREHNANISRLIGDRLTTLALGLSCHGPVEMEQHVEAMGEYLRETWNEDGLEHPLVYESIGRLGLLTPTTIDDLQKPLTKRVEGRIPRSGKTGPIDRAALNGLLLAVSSGPAYPFRQTDENLPKPWHWDENTPPLASWDLLLPFLHTLWTYHWNQDDTGGAVRDIGPMLGSWWNDNPPAEGFFDNHPEIWEGILMFCWATAPRMNHVWEQLEERYDELSIEDENLRTMTETYFDWARTIQEDGEPPRESFNGQRLPPNEWIRPLPSDIISDYSQPSYDFPESWCDQMARLEPPEPGNL